MTNKVSVYITAAVKRCKLPIGMRWWIIDYPHEPDRFEISWPGRFKPLYTFPRTPRQATDAYLALCRTLEGQ